jgi:nucleotide-binding universal stress UspA family protein
MTKLLKLSRVSATARSLAKLDGRLRLTHLLVPVDFSAGTKDVICYAAAFARRFGASLTLLHVIKPICEIDFGYGSVVRRCQSQALVDHIKARLNTLGKRWSGLRFKPQALVRTGSAENEIVAAARQLETDLIIMGTRGVWHPPGTPNSSIAEQVIHCAPCPVLIVRNKDRAWVSNRKSRQL